MDNEETTADDEVEEEEVEEQEEPPPAAEESESKEPEKAEEPAAPKTFDEMKIVINSKGKNYMVGVQSPDCDPVYDTFKGTLATVLKKIPKLVENAKKQWLENPKYPKADLPEPPAPTQSPARSTSSRSKPKAEDETPSFF